MSKSGVEVLSYIFLLKIGCRFNKLLSNTDPRDFDYVLLGPDG